ncbi:hypothetical protein BGX34_001593 [Mortierella sp. NVP85]|nr:hypothetical protein BGX34_001593 [Mortierella sp. NVP85]
MSSIQSSLDSDMKCLDRTDNLQGISITGPNPELNYKAEPSEGAMLNQLYIKSESDAFRTTFGEALTGPDMVLSDERLRIQRELQRHVHSKSRMLTKLAREQASDQDGFEMDESIRKSTIMMKRLRSKSDSKKSECEYRTEQDDHDQAPACKKQFQEIWQKEERSGHSGQTGNQSTAAPHSRAYMPLQPAREDGGCVLCLQTYDSPENLIVLCDKCDRGFHQLCYSPPIENKYVEIPDLEWTCYLCSQPLSSTSSHGLSELTEDMSLTGQQVPQNVKESYLRSLSKSNLVKLISRIESSSPTMKLYPSRLSSPPTVHQDNPSFAPSISRTLGPADLSQRTDQDMLSGSAKHDIPGVQAEYFDPLATHFQPVTGSPLSSIQEATIADGNSSDVSAKSSAATTFASQVEAMKAGTSGTSSQSPTPSTPKILGRQTPTTGTGTYPSVKALDLPPYEEMIFAAIGALNQEGGSAPKAILDWVQANYPVPESFRASCGQAISKAAKKGRLLKDGSMYKLKPGYNYPRSVAPIRVYTHAFTIAQFVTSNGFTS